MDREVALAVLKVLSDIVLAMLEKSYTTKPPIGSVAEECAEECGEECEKKCEEECEEGSEGEERSVEELITPLKADVEEFGNILSRQRKPQKGRYRVPVNSEHHLPPP